MIVLPGSASKRLAVSLSEQLGCPLAKVESKPFPDGERYVRVDSDLMGKTVIIVQNTYPDEKLVELFILQDAVREFKDTRIVTVIPYFGYARQDKVFKPGETIAARTMAKRIQSASDQVILIDIHAPTIADWFDVPCKSVSSMADIAEYLKDKEVDAILAPDKGALARAGEVAKELGVDFDHMEKTRVDGFTVSMKPKDLDVSGKRVVIVDDIIATGGTIIKATEHLKANGAKEVWAACTHGLFTNDAVPRLDAVLDRLIATDTLESESTKLSVAPSIVRALED